MAVWHQGKKLDSHRYDVHRVAVIVGPVDCPHPVPTSHVG